MTPRTQVVEEARKWLGVPWKHQGRSRQGLDCAGLIVVVAQALKLSTFDSSDYGRIPDGISILQICKDNLVELPKYVPMKAGQILLMKFERHPQHLGIVGDYSVPGEVSLIHSYAGSRKCTEHRLDSIWTSRILYKFDYPGVEA